MKPTLAVSSVGLVDRKAVAPVRCRFTAGWLACRDSVVAVNATELLELLGRIEESAIRGEVVEALLLCQKLGGDASSAELRGWARNELEGYPQEATPPEYRRVRGQLFGDGAAPGQRISGAAIPMDALPREVSEELAKGLPARESISELEARAGKEHSKLGIHDMGKMLELINSANTSLVTYDMAYLGISGAAFRGLITAVRSRIVELATQVRSSLPDRERLGIGTVRDAVTEALSSSIMVVGDHNALIVGDGTTANVSAVSDSRPPAEPTPKVWRWLKRVLEAIVSVGTGVSVLWGGSFNPM